MIQQHESITAKSKNSTDENIKGILETKTSVAQFISTNIKYHYATVGRLCTLVRCKWRINSIKNETCLKLPYSVLFYSSATLIFMFGYLCKLFFWLLQ